MLTLNKTNFFKQPDELRGKADTRLGMGTLASPTRIISVPKREAVMMDRWLEYDLVALAMLVFGIAAVEFLALSF
jgi:hypothetical protein